VNYGFGYFGNGYEGGYWRDRHFYYNRTVNNVTITHVHIYNKTVINNITVNRISYNGGHGGINAHPTREQEVWGHEHHFEPTHMQQDHERGAGSNRAFFASENHGRPSIAATSHPGEFHGPRVVSAREERSPLSRPDTHPIPGPENRVRSNDRHAPHSDYNSGREVRPSPESYRAEDTGSRDRGHEHENVGPHSNGGQHEHTPHQKGEGHSDHGQDQHPH
jgi:hypothetical protein